MSTPTDLSGQLEPWQKEARAQTTRILQGLSGKRSDEQWEEYKARTIQMFRDKGLFRNLEQSKP